jgi:hypothetical protein
VAGVVDRIDVSVLLAGVSRLMDLLSDSREIIRNEVKTDKYFFIQ